MYPAEGSGSRSAFPSSFSSSIFLSASGGGRQPGFCKEEIGHSGHVFSPWRAQAGKQAQKRKARPTEDVAQAETGLP